MNVKMKKKLKYCRKVDCRKGTNIAYLFIQNTLIVGRIKYVAHSEKIIEDWRVEVRHDSSQIVVIINTLYIIFKLILTY